MYIHTKLYLYLFQNKNVILFGWGIAWNSVNIKMTLPDKSVTNSVREISLLFRYNSFYLLMGSYIWMGPIYILHTYIIYTQMYVTSKYLQIFNFRRWLTGVVNTYTIDTLLSWDHRLFIIIVRQIQWFFVSTSYCKILVRVLERFFWYLKCIHARYSKREQALYIIQKLQSVVSFVL